MSLEDKVEEAKEAIDKVFGDTSVTPGETREALEELQGHIDDQINTIGEV